MTLNKKELVLSAMTFIDPETGWFEIVEIPDKKSGTLSQLLEQVWLTRYPRPSKIIFDNGTEFKKDFRYIIDDFGIKPTPTSVKNPQANSVLERVHKVLTNMLRSKNIKRLDLNPDDPWIEILSSVGYAIRSTYHTTLGATPAQIIYGRDMVNPVTYIAEWDVIRKNKEKSIQKSNERENKIG